jgi:hypothetical protein
MRLLPKDSRLPAAGLSRFPPEQISGGHLPEIQYTIRTSEKYFSGKDLLGKRRKTDERRAGTGLLEGFLRYLFGTASDPS